MKIRKTEYLKKQQILKLWKFESLKNRKSENLKNMKTGIIIKYWKYKKNVFLSSRALGRGAADYFGLGRGAYIDIVQIDIVHTETAEA